VQEGILLALGELSGNNRIAQGFYNGPRFERFRFWENLFLLYAGGLKGARRQILRHLPLQQGSLLEVGVGDGHNVRLLPEQVHVTGIDIALRRLAVCRRRCADRPLRLALAEGEHIPFESRSFDGVLCVGGFNFFSDPAAALAEMTRVTRPGGRIVVADEIPDFLRYGWGHRLRIPALDHWLMKRWFGEEFRDMVLRTKIDPDRLALEALDRPQIHRIWRGYGYCMVGSPR
jgi:ubiquinone/menaquinone biosynthesis C-methylase UbiE